uniref:YbjN domain-containing protein n=1 Tax=Pseudictyota dubia TaxID=2749911 RepID=A0A7R9WB96_9STRA|mmetsp:Transcript_40759/g.75447  ORF Transcript_40759/g.75447 Transcript_40759/m.75447 type:complete len:220 (+) Transcript_40759:129-788(+)|eukprot:CAMPEP_0197459366 /NCGR_PEP_ID=MMETSP1175-20131217/51220_1 /TAXON_ID=1003142 /ORGANISM="Triceratium dubium, Strain CCMP147" /LENGTH=219 /DNA_ID=CAMNT_0042994225 /DNA_START=117 /DNA_END=776 /DNA_ORIENTATION=-
MRPLIIVDNDTGGGDESRDTNEPTKEGSAEEGTGDNRKEGVAHRSEQKAVIETRSADKPSRDMGRILKTVHKMLTGAGSKFFIDPDRDMIRMTATGKHATYKVVFYVKEEKEQLFVYVCCSNLAPAERRIQVAEFIARANWGLAIGNFQIDMNDGEMRYKVSIDAEEGELSCKMVQNMLAASTQTMERYFPGLMSVCYGNKEAAAAVAEAEGEVRFVSQ